MVYSRLPPGGRMSAAVRVSCPVPETIFVPGGCFRMGSDAGRPDEAPVHDAEVGGFRLGRTPVTRAQYAAFLAGGDLEPPRHWSDPAFSFPSQPVVGVTW